MPDQWPNSMMLAAFIVSGSIGSLNVITTCVIVAEESDCEAGETPRIAGAARACEPNKRVTIDKNKTDVAFIV